MKATVTLTFDGLISKSIGTIYTPETNVCAKFDEPRSVLCLVSVSYHPDNVWSIYQYVDSHCDLDLWPTDLKIDKDHLYSETHVCSKFDKPRSILCLVIIRIRFGQPTDRPTDRRTDRPTDICKAKYPHFVEGGITITYDRKAWTNKLNDKKNKAQKDELILRWACDKGMSRACDKG